MPITVGQFVERLSQSGLMSSADVAAFQKALPPERQPHDAPGLVRELMQARKLTRFQAEAILQGRTKGLVFG